MTEFVTLTAWQGLQHGHPAPYTFDLNKPFKVVKCKQFSIEETKVEWSDRKHEHKKHSYAGQKPP